MSSGERSGSGAPDRLSVSVDARCLTALHSGTQTFALALIEALHAYSKCAIRVLLPAEVDSDVSAALDACTGLTVLAVDELEGSLVPSDVVHRPHQVSSWEDFGVFEQLGRRLVITQLDQIAYRDLSYFSAAESSADYRLLTEKSLAAADQVTFLSRHALDEAVALRLVSPDRASVVYPPLQALLARATSAPRRPPELASVGEDGFLACLGSDYRHKNRLFAIRLLEALERRDEFHGDLVFAGLSVSAGSSREEERTYLAERPGLAGRVHDLGAVSEATKAWLLEEAQAVVYPTTSEGFGLVPFEAARAGTPCLFAPVSALAEVLPPSAALLVPWEAEASARRVARVLGPGRGRHELIATIGEAARRFGDAQAAQALDDVYASALAGTPVTRAEVDAERYRRAAARTGEELSALREDLDGARGRAAELECLLGERSAELERAEVSLAEARAEVDALAAALGAAREVLDHPLNRGLVGPHAVVDLELRRAVLAVATRPKLNRLVVAAYRLARRLGGRRRG